MTHRSSSARLVVGVVVGVAMLVAACSGDDAGAPETSTTRAEAVEQIALRGDGLGVVDLGAPPEVAVSAVNAALGDPSLDTGWESSFGRYGTCPGEAVRAVEWGGLVLLFTDGATEQGSGEHLFAWRVRSAPPALSTTEGFGLGATVTDAEQLYPGAVEAFPPEPPFPGFLELSAHGGTIYAYLQGDTVTNLEAGTPCGE